MSEKLARFSTKILFRKHRGKLSRAFLTPEFLELSFTGNAEEHRGEIFLARKIERAKSEDW